VVVAENERVGILLQWVPEYLSGRDRHMCQAANRDWNHANQAQVRIKQDGYQRFLLSLSELSHM
jgi:hypothetical protein